jgi:hypothetical protein
MHNKKTKTILSTLTLLGAGAIILKSIYDYSMYKILKDIEKSIKKNSWEYYE